MADLRLPGLFTGIDTNELITQLMALERRTLEKYQQRQAVWDERKTALSDLESRLSTLRTSVRAISDANELRTFKAASSDTDILTAEASYNAFEGNHTIIINQLATAERWVHTAGLEYSEDYVGEGTFIYSYNHKETVLTTTATTTLEDLAGLINNDADNPGVTASLLYYNEAYHLILNGNEAGTDYQISINATNTEVWQAASPFTVDGSNATLGTKITSLDQFDFNGGAFAGDEKIIITGNKHDGTAVNAEIPINSNTKLTHIISEINDAFGGTATTTLENGKIVLTDNTCGTSQMQITLAYNKGTGPTTFSIPAISRLTEGGTVPANPEDYLAGFEPSAFTETQSAQDSQIRVDGYPSGDWISRSSNTIDDVIQGVTLHLHDTGTIDLTLTRDVQAVKDKLNTMITAYNTAVTYIKEKTGYNDVLKTAGVLMGDYVVSNIKNLLTNTLITRTDGFVTDIDTFLMPGQIGLELDSYGMLSLDSTAFDEAIAEDYLGTLAIIGADKTGSTNSNTIKFYGASSAYTTAGTYNVEVKITDNQIEYARIKLSTESTYRNMTVNGNIVTGNSTFDDDGNPLYPENALQLSVDLSQNGTFTAEVRIKQGFAGAMEDILDDILKVTTGSIQIDQEYIDDQIEHIQERIDDEEYRLAQKESRLITRFALLEKTLALLQNQMSALGLSSA